MTISGNDIKCSDDAGFIVSADVVVNAVESGGGCEAMDHNDDCGGGIDDDDENVDCDDDDSL